MSNLTLKFVDVYSVHKIEKLDQPELVEKIRREMLNLPLKEKKWYAQRLDEIPGGVWATDHIHLTKHSFYNSKLDNHSNTFPWRAAIVRTSIRESPIFNANGILLSCQELYIDPFGQKIYRRTSSGDGRLDESLIEIIKNRLVLKVVDITEQFNSISEVDVTCYTLRAAQLWEGIVDEYLERMPNLNVRIDP